MRAMQGRAEYRGLPAQEHHTVEHPAGGESGPDARPRGPFFVKQWGGVNKNKSGRLLDGATYAEMPKRSGIYHQNYALNLQ